MFKFENGGTFIQSTSELPLELIGAERVVMDFETTSYDRDIASVNPHHNCYIAGIAFSTNTTEEVYYIDYMHMTELEQNYVGDYIYALLTNCKEWVNQNVKYDAHVCRNQLHFMPECNLVCTMTLAKLINSDRLTHGGYGLTALMRDWCKKDISKYEARLQPYLSGNKIGNKMNQDYGLIPADILGEYACEDVYSVKLLMAFIEANLPEQCYGVRDTEIELTQNLFQMECNGMPINMLQVQIAQYKLLNRLMEIDVRLAELVGWHVTPNSNDDCYHLFINQFGLPILAYTKNDEGESTGNASFDKNVLKLYASHPLAPKEIVNLIQEYRHLSQLNSLFLEPWQRLATNGLLHPTYNQIVRTGRMSCSDPNAQQLSSDAKELIVPGEGMSFLSIDYSQIELRTIVHYINDIRAIQQFEADPDIDFHIMVANDCGIKRKPAKTVNFGVAFGEGKAKLTKQLATDDSLVGEFVTKVDQLIAEGKVPKERRAEVFNMLATKRAEEVLVKYFARFPTLKKTSKDTEMVCKRRGYIFNGAGRRRHLPPEFAYRSFNTLNQSFAADIMKNRANAVCKLIKGTAIKLIAIVHDEFLFIGPTSQIEDFRTKRDIVCTLESNPFKMSVPVRCSCGTSSKNWKEAGKSISDGGNGAPLKYNKSDFDNLNHLRNLV